jgi:ubiquinone/menaquinone biosynthesis C-methylase UbiE
MTPGYSPLVLHAGCGDDHLPFYMKHAREFRVDIDPEVKPDLVADMAHLPDNIGPFDAIYCAHSLEHLNPHDVQPCLEGFLRVLKPGGAVTILVPDLEGLSPTDEVLYVSEGGPVCAFDLFYGFRKYLQRHPYMAHRCGFVQSTLHAALERAGFESVKAVRLHDEYKFNLWGFGLRGKA